MNIDILQHYKYIVNLDLSSNLLSELTVLSHLLYLQYLSVAFNRLNTVLEYETRKYFNYLPKPFYIRLPQFITFWYFIRSSVVLNGGTL